MSSSVRARGVRFDQDSLWVELSDGRVLGVPLAWFPRLLHGSAEQRESGVHQQPRAALGGVGRGHLP